MTIVLILTELVLLFITQQDLQYNTACTNLIAIDGDDLEDVKTFTHLGSIIDEQDGFDAHVKARIGKTRAVSTTEEHLELKATVDQH
ncbi:unnamed protein product [Schistosoma mattheei]|uniref:Uncharacterized protein n=1 Tax=Schistosoma mattheei TaxID=31246 RepID=A0A183PQV7_9TREM|nr:unnamed protein product [Schistosoma mattheei]